MSNSQFQENVDDSFLPNPQINSPASSTFSNNADINLESELTNHTIPSSPVSSQKEKRLPSITPKKFTRFFTPRSLKDGAPRQALFDITTPAINDRVIPSTPLRIPTDIQNLDTNFDSFSRDLKRRKVSQGASIATLKSGKEGNDVEGTLVLEEIATPEKPIEKVLISPFRRASRRNVDQEIIAQAVSIPKQKTTFEERGLSGQLLGMSLGSSRRTYTSYPVSDWQSETSGFYSKPVDTHLCNSHQSGESALPFCTATCNKSTLVALGDENGRVKILESESGGKPPFHQSYLSFKHHTNAIFDMSFSQDDSLLATASADQSAKVVDMMTQQTISTLAQHTASVKQVRFQPGSSNNSILATSSRDGSIQIWDLRCRGNGGAIKEIYKANDPILARVNQPGYGYAINSIYDAHKPYVPPGLVGKQRKISERASVPSVTTISFMPEGQEHLLLTASEDNASVKVWDIRALYQTHKEWAIPLSSTQQPQSHSSWRHFGVISMNLGGDGSRLYTLCKDSTVYAYSTAHLILGHAPELSSNAPKWRRPTETQRDGLGALYGFRHPKLLTNSFYVKSHLRTEKDGKCEMIAVGSSKDGSAVLFPTDERYHSFSNPEEELQASLGPILRKRPIIRRSGSGNTSRVMSDDVPISQNGTALIKGHDKEVSSLAWTSQGELITLSDDYLVRCWREGPEARDLRMGGEEGGRRWASGWAEVKEGFDDDDD